MTEANGGEADDGGGADGADDDADAGREDGSNETVSLNGAVEGRKRTATMVPKTAEPRTKTKACTRTAPHGPLFDQA